MTLLSARQIRRIVLDQSHRAHVGHIGSSLSIADILAALYGRVLRIETPDDPQRDRFILSKGHAVLGLYAALHLKGWLSGAALNTYCGDGTLLGSHPDRLLPGVEFSTGSLGHGLSVGVGAALAARLRGSAYRVYVLVSDAECNEGALWEAMMFAAHQGLSNLIAVIDCNGQQAFGYTRDVLSLAPLADKWREFGWDVRETDGHDVEGLAALLDGFETGSGSPHAVVARTVFGKGVSFMESRIAWHYLPMSEEQYRQAVQEIEATG